MTDAQRVLLRELWQNGAPNGKCTFGVQGPCFHPRCLQFEAGTIMEAQEMTAPNDSLLNEVCARLRSPFAVFERSHDHNYAVGVARMGEAADAIEALRKENDFLRAHIGNNAKACVYCGLGADEQAKCVSGFPGCARADDQMLCREAGVGIERDALAKQVRVMVAWLEEHQIDVFSRGMWDAIAIGKEEGP